AGGCQAPAPPPPVLGRPTPPTATATAPAEAAAPATGPIDAATLFPLQPRSGMMRIMEGPQAGKLLPFELEQADDHWVLTLQSRQRVYLRQDPQGGLAIFREDDLTEQVQVEYDPALPML